MEVRRWGFGEGSRPEPAVLEFTAAEGAAQSRLIQSQTTPTALPAYLITHLLHVLMTD